MQNQLIPFTYEGTRIRVIEIDGDPWFVASDVCAVLEVGNPTQALTRLDEDEVTLISNEGRQTNTISESGLYSLVLGSRKPQAKPFKRWVTSEVLPSIRKTGAYGQVQQLMGPALYLAAIEQAQTEIAALEARTAELEPKAARYDDFLGSKGDYSIRQAATILQRDHGIETGGNRLIQTLLDWGWVYRHGKSGTVTAYQAQLETGRLSQRATTYLNQKTGEIVNGDPQTRVTPKGIADMAARIRKQVAA